MARNKAFEPEEKLEMAKCLFWKKGYNATSMQDLVETMGLNRGSIYDTYGDKHSLFLQCLQRYTESTFEEYKKVADDTKSPIKAVEKIIRKSALRTVEEGRTCLGIKSTFELASVDEAVHAVLKENTTKLVAVLKDLLKKAQKADEISSKRDPEVLARFIVANFTGFWQFYVVYGDAEVVNQQAEFLIKSIKK